MDEQLILSALKIGRDAAFEVAQTYHAAMKGYRKYEHDRLDADVAKIDAAIAALSQPAATQGDLRVALGFYADLERYNGPNQRVVRDRDPFTPEDAVYIQDVTRDRGQIARDALAGIAP